MPIEVSDQVSNPYPVFDIDSARKAGVSETDIFNHFKQTNPNDYNYDAAIKAGITPDKINDFVANKINTQPSLAKLKNGLIQAKDKTIDLIRPIVDSLGVAAGAGAGAAGGPAGAIAVGSAAGLSSDAIMQALQSSRAQSKNRSLLAEVTGADKGSAGETAANAAQFVGLNELLGGLFNKASSVVKGIKAPDSALESLDPTFSQLHGNGKLSSLMENIFAGGPKGKAMLNSSDIGRSKFQDLIESPEIAGGRNLPTTDRMAIGSLNKRFTNGTSGVNEIGNKISVDVPPEFTPIKHNGFLDDPQDKSRYLNNIVSGIKDNHFIGGTMANDVPLQKAVNGTDLNLYKNGNNGFILGKESPGVGIKVYGSIVNKPGGKGIENIAVSPEYQNKGLGTLLLNANKNAGFSINSVPGNGVSQEGASLLNKFNQSQLPAPVKVQAPIYLENTIKEAQDFLADSANKPNVDPKLIQQAKLIIQHTNGGKNPIPFQDAMDILHGNDGVSGLEAKSLKAPGELSPDKDQLGNFADSLDKDIQTSIGQKWNSPQALAQYQDARSASLIKSQITQGGKVQDLVGNSLTKIPSIDNILTNTNETQKLLNRSNVDGLPSTNMRQDLAGYRLNQIWSKADPNGTGIIDGQKLISEWNDPRFQDTKDLLYSKQAQQGLDELFNNIKTVTQNGMSSNFNSIRMTTHGILLGGSLLTGQISGHAIGSFLGAEVPAYAIARLMTKPATAKILTRMISGAPLDASQEQAGRLIMSGLNGLTINLMDKDGKETTVKVQGGRVSGQ